WRHQNAGEDRRLAFGVAARLRLPQLHYQVEEGGGLVAFEGDDEFLVVEAERIRGIDLDLRVAMPDREVLDHHRLAPLVGKGVQERLLHHGEKKKDASARG